MSTCREALTRIFEYLDGELTPETADSIRQHLEACKDCQPCLRFAQAFQEAVRRAANGQSCAPEHLRERLAGLLQDEDDSLDA